MLLGIKAYSIMLSWNVFFWIVPYTTPHTVYSAAFTAWFEFSAQVEESQDNQLLGKTCDVWHNLQKQLFSFFLSINMHTSNSYYFSSWCHQRDSLVRRFRYAFHQQLPERPDTIVAVFWKFDGIHETLSWCDHLLLSNEIRVGAYGNEVYWDFTFLIILLMFLFSNEMASRSCRHIRL